MAMPSSAPLCLQMLRIIWSSVTFGTAMLWPSTRARRGRWWPCSTAHVIDGQLPHCGAWCTSTHGAKSDLVSRELTTMSVCLQESWTLGRSELAYQRTGASLTLLYVKMLGDAMNATGTLHPGCSLKTKAAETHILMQFTLDQLVTRGALLPHAKNLQHAGEALLRWLALRHEADARPSQ